MTDPILSRRQILAGLASLAGSGVLLGACGSGSGGGTAGTGAPAPVPAAGALAVEKPSLTLGFIKLTDMAPLAIAKEKNFFTEEGLNVGLEPQSNWKVLLDGVIGGQLDGAHMLAGQPLAATVGYGTAAELIAPLSLDLNGNAVTLSNAIWAMLEPELATDADGKPEHPISATSLLPVVATLREQGRLLNLGMVFPVSTHNYELRYWLAAGGIVPGFYAPDDANGTIASDVNISVTPPPQMPATLEAGTIDGYCVGEPWNQAAVQKGIGVPVVTDEQIWHLNPEKVLGLRKDFADRYPGTTAAMLRAVIKAQQWLDADDGANRAEAVEILARSQYVGADAEVIGASMTGTFTFGPGDTRPAPDFNIFFREFAGYPYYSDAIWYLTQMRRWGQIPEEKPDDWYVETAEAVYRPDLYRQAAEALVDANIIPAESVPETDGYKPETDQNIDSHPYDGATPTAYLESLEIGLKAGQTVTAAGVR